MSFRKRSDVIGRPGEVSGGAPETVPRKNVIQSADAVPGISGRGVPGRPVGGIGSRGPPNPTTARGPPRPTGGIAVKHIPVETPALPEIPNGAIRPSLITSQPTVSTGVSDLDKLLSHQGLPLGQSLLIEESGTTDFASVLLRCFASQGIFHDRNEGSASHIIVLGVHTLWGTELPGLYKGTSRDQKKAKIFENETKVSVSNLAQSGSRDMKIAWRYELNKPQQENIAVDEDDQYNNQFDITQKLVPAPNAHEITYVSISASSTQLILQINNIIEAQLKSTPSKIVRLVIPNLLNPSVYPPSCSAFTYIVPLVHSLRALTRKYADNLVLISSVPLDLYPRSGTLMGSLENLFDSVIHLQPFNQEMSQFIEKAHKNEREKIQHGLVNIIKSPVLSERGLMMIHNGEYAFKNGRKRFEIEEWGIPVEDDDQAQTRVDVAY